MGNPDGVGEFVIGETSREFKIAALLNLIENSIARLRVDLALRCQAGDALGFIVEIHTIRIHRCCHL